MKYIGLIIGLEENRAVVLTAESKVMGIKKSEGMFLGQKVFFSHNDILTVKRRRINFYMPAIAGVAALLMLVFGYFKFFYSSETLVFIDVDINPSIEFAVDGKSVVKDVRPINKDADALTQNLDLENIPFAEALKKYIDNAIEEGYLNENKENSNYLLVSAALNPKSSEFKKSRVNTEKRLDFELENLKDDLHKVYSRNFKFEIVKVPEYYKEKSMENNISLGKYMVYERIRKKGNSITIDEIKSDNLYNLLKKNGLLPLYEKNTNILPKTTPVKFRETITDHSPIVPTPTVATNTKAIISTHAVSNTLQPKFTPEVTGRVKVTPSTYKTPVYYITPTFTLKPTQIIIPSDMPKETDTAQYNFENGIQDFKITNAIEFYSSSDNAYAGTKSLKIRMRPGEDEYIDTSKVDPSIKYGTTITFHVWIPDTTEITAVEAFYQDANWEWTGNWNFYSQLTPNKWNTIKLKVLDDEILPIRRIGVKIAAKDKNFSGDVYIDSISWN
ncbi:anti-sigma factor domain-containing protein [Pseudobacteroides cellulosolvens]|uniref:Anti-sigma factor RsgI, N-terminal n=1 Tax=Pseudobacteroides cellulosolvens ATCC 35603 = DSM 2933 TaxID=398512 RepID=A0A0L6JWQ1_9FIRM|nr:anti-sigma factor domain-containing protein [Pseudobacteroides cellulosolvens]KNY29857.1 Anti-sigma factor RsgI, N-terminal [Pseudobacteroides cellulosolvens ATCC 35603 = DSM 2933]